MDEGSSIRHFHGVDFSGAKDAGTRIWLATVVPRGDTLYLEACHPACVLPGSGMRPGECLPALRDFIRCHSDCAFGCDFPFGLPRELVREATWEEFVLGFGARYPTSESFQCECALAASGRELRRATDREARVPFCAYNVRLFRQTYHGIRDLLAPLVRDEAISVVPMQRPRAGRAVVAEICPASTLKREGVYCPYKGRGPERRAARERVLRHFEDDIALAIESDALRTMLLDDPGGDALDSVIAAVVAHRIACTGWRIGQSRRALYQIEGYVYV